MKLFMILALIYSFGINLILGARIGIALFNETDSGIHGMIALHRNPGFGTFLIGQIRNISCFNSSSATRDPLQVSPTNSCLLGLTINNWRQNTTESQYYISSRESAIRSTIFNLSAIKLPDIKEILSTSFKPLPNPSMTTTQRPRIWNKINGQSRECRNVGDVYNPHNSILGSGPFGFLSPPGVLGNLMVHNGTGSLLMGPLELFTADMSPAVIGLPLVVWMDSIRPEISSGVSIKLAAPPNDRLLECSTILSMNS